LRLALIQEWSSFNPINSQLASNEALFQFIIRRMSNRAANGKVLPDIAENIPPLKNKVAQWKIKKNAKWADGHEILCEDWQLGWKAGLNPNVTVEARNMFSKITDISWDKKTPQICLVTYATNDWTYDRDLPPLLPAHIERSIFEKTNKDSQGYDRNSRYVSYPNLVGLYNGPYSVSEFKLGDHIILTRNKYFYGQQPEYDKIVISLVSDSSSLKAQLQTKQIDGVSAVGFPPDTAISFDEEFQKSNSIYQVHFQNSAIFQGIFFNLDSEILKDRNVREALYRAIDKEALVKAFYKNKMKAAEGILPPQHPSFRSRPSMHSKKKANAILQKSGWILNKNNFREKEGKTLSFVFKTSAGIKVLENIQVFICDQFKDIGAECIIKNEPPRTLLGASVPHGEYELAMYGQPIPPDTSLTSYFSSVEIPTTANSWAGGNSMRIRSLELDQMLKDFDGEANSEKRNKIVQKIEKYFQDEFLFIPLYHRREAIVLPKKLEGIRESFEGTSFFQPENWRTKKPVVLKTELPSN
jgi:peptide/nickel transport system substrate-binding protein